MTRKKKVSKDDNSTDICYTISIPELDDVAFSNFKSLLAGKEKIIMRAFGIEKLPNMSGKEYKKDRTVLLSRLTGSSTLKKRKKVMIINKENIFRECLI